MKNISMMMTLVALMALMAHIVVPHHHHKDGICIGASNAEQVETGCGNTEACSQCAPQEDCSHNAPQGSHSGESQKQGCKAYDPFLNRNTSGDEDVNKLGADISLCLPVVAVLLFDGGWSAIQTIAFKPPVTEVNLHFIVKSLGLRAPPVPV